MFSSIISTSFALLPNNSFQFLYLFTNTYLSFYSHLGGYKLVSYCGFDIYFLKDNNVEHLFYAYCSFVYLWRYVYWDPLPFFIIQLFIFLLLSCKCSLYFLNTNLLLDTWFIKVFPCGLSFYNTNLLVWWCPLYFFFYFLCFWCYV